MDSDTRALNLSWSFGFNCSLPGGVHNLTDGTRQALFYAAGHTGVIYDFEKEKQTLLQGHCNFIAATSVSADKRWAATGDYGSGSMITVWDTWTGTPVKSLFDPHNGSGIIAMDMSPDGSCLVTLGADFPQTLCVWDWTTCKDEALHSCLLPSAGDIPQSCVRINPEDAHEIIVNGQSAVQFVVWDAIDGIQVHVPELNHKEFHHDKPAFTYSAFIPGNSQACTATASGDVVVWSDRALENLSNLQPKGKKTGVKFVKLHNTAINFITPMGDQHIVTGGEDGHVKVYDLQFRLLTFFERLKSGPVTSVAFSAINEASGSPTEAVMADVNLPSFVVATKHAKVVCVTKNLEADAVPLIRTIITAQIETVEALVAHPSKNIFAVSGSGGLLQTWDYDTKSVIQQRAMGDPGIGVTALAYSADGKNIAVGLSSGTVKILHSKSLNDINRATFKLGGESITRISWAPDSDYLATADTSFAVGIISFSSKGDNGSDNNASMYIGRYQAHTKPIIGILFNKSRDGDALNLFSFSQDRTVVEYDLTLSTVSEGVKLKSRKHLEQTSRPLALCVHPELANENLILFANSAMKFRLHNASTFLCRRTLLAPSYGGEIHSLQVLPKADSKSDLAYLAYASKERIVGLVKVPLDGNPHKAMGLIAHPGEISAIACTSDGKYLLSVGRHDATIHCWALNTAALEAQARLAGEGMDPFLNMLGPGGIEGAAYREMEDYFFYAQLRVQGEDSTEERRIGHRLAIGEVASIMQAVGFYPSQREVFDMLNEIRFTNLANSVDEVETVTFDEIIRLYLNHRPAAPPSKEEIASSLRFARDRDNPELYSRKALSDLLQQYGEAMSANELDCLLETLVKDTELEGQLPAEFDLRTFVCDILGFVPEHDEDRAGTEVAGFAEGTVA